MLALELFLFSPASLRQKLLFWFSKIIFLKCVFLSVKNTVNCVAAAAPATPAAAAKAAATSRR